MVNFAEGAFAYGAWGSTKIVIAGVLHVTKIYKLFLMVLFCYITMLFSEARCCTRRRCYILQRIQPRAAISVSRSEMLVQQIVTKGVRPKRKGYTLRKNRLTKQRPELMEILI